RRGCFSRAGACRDGPRTAIAAAAREIVFCGEVIAIRGAAWRSRPGPRRAPAAERRRRDGEGARLRWRALDRGSACRRMLAAARPLGWQGFAERARPSPLPIYALGGLTPADVDSAIDHGAHGVALRRGAWVR